MESRRVFVVVVAVLALMQTAWCQVPARRVTTSKASEPRPADGETGVTVPLLQWTPGVRAVFHEVYFGTDPQPGEAQFVGRQPVAMCFNISILKPETTYYWRVDEVEADGVTKHVGDVWSFTTGEETPLVCHYIDGRRGRDENDGLSPETAFATIQKGIDSAADGETVLVYPGVYRKPIDFLGKAITVRSAEQPAVLAVGTEFAVSFFTGEGPDSVLENFIIRDSFLGIFIVQSSPTLRNLTVVGNKYGLEAYAQGQPEVVNCIFWDNTADDLVGCGARYSCIERGADGIGNFNSDPLFADPDDNDYHLRSERGRYWPEHDVWVLDKVTSPCIDAGDPLADYSNEPRPHGGRINLGAYGGTPWASLTPLGQMANYPPLVMITAPQDETRFDPWPETIRIEAQALDIDGRVVKVEFFVEGEKVGEDTDASDGWTMDVTDSPLSRMRSSYHPELRARATDDEGACVDSLPIHIYAPVRVRR